MWHDRQIDLLQDHLVLALLTEHVLTPSTGIAPAVVKCGCLWRQANSLHVFGQLNWRVQEEQGHIIVQGTFIVLLVDDEIAYLPVLVRPDLVLCLRVPLAGPDLQLGGLLARHAVGGRENDLRMDQGAAALVHVKDLFEGLLLPQDSHHPWELAILRLVVLVARNSEAYTINIPVSTAWPHVHGGNNGLGAAICGGATPFNVVGTGAWCILYVDTNVQQTVAISNDSAIRRAQVVRNTLATIADLQGNTRDIWLIWNFQVVQRFVVLF